MRKYQPTEKLTLPLVDVVKEKKQEPAKRVNIVSLKMVRESSLLYKNRKIKSPEDAYHLLKPFLVDSDREQLMLLTLDTKN